MSLYKFITLDKLYFKIILLYKVICPISERIRLEKKY